MARRRNPINTGEMILTGLGLVAIGLGAYGLYSKYSANQVAASGPNPGAFPQGSSTLQQQIAAGNVTVAQQEAAGILPPGSSD